MHLTDDAGPDDRACTIRSSRVDVIEQDVNSRGCGTACDALCLRENSVEVVGALSQGLLTCEIVITSNV